MQNPFKTPTDYEVQIITSSSSSILLRYPCNLPTADSIEMGLELMLGAGQRIRLVQGRAA